MSRSTIRILFAALAVGCAAIATPRADAQSAFFTFTPVGGLSFDQGGTLRFNIHLTVTGLSGGAATQPGAQNIQGLTYFLQQTSGPTFVFSITGRDITGSPFTDLISTQTQVSASPGNLVDADGNERDLGALADNPFGNGTYTIATITLTMAPNAPLAQYTFQTVSTGGRAAVFNDSEGDTFPIQPGTLSIVPLSIPEPSPLALIGVSLCALVVVGRFGKLLHKA